jgi:hypothetical protein
MTTYNFRNKKTGKEFTEFFQNSSEVDEYLKDKPHVEWLCSAVGIADPMRLGRVKPSQDFRDRLKHIKKSHRGSTINTW